MMTGTCAGTFYRALDVKILVAHGGMNTQPVDFIKIINGRSVVLGIIIEETDEKNRVHHFTLLGSTMMVGSKTSMVLYTIRTLMTAVPKKKYSVVKQVCRQSGIWTDTTRFESYERLTIM